MILSEQIPVFKHFPGLLQPLARNLPYSDSRSPTNDVRTCPARVASRVRRSQLRIGSRLAQRESEVSREDVSRQVYSKLPSRDPWLRLVRALL